MFAITGRFSARKGLFDLLKTVRFSSWADETFCFLVLWVFEKYSSKLTLVFLGMLKIMFLHCWQGLSPGTGSSAHGVFMRCWRYMLRSHIPYWNLEPGVLQSWFLLLCSMILCLVRKAFLHAKHFFCWDSDSYKFCGSSWRYQHSSLLNIHSPLAMYLHFLKDGCSSFLCSIKS